MQLQKHLFQLPSDVHYLNGAASSPLLKSVEEIGYQGIVSKRNPALILPKDTFVDIEKAKALFGKLINCAPSQVAIVPASSYGLLSAVQNVPTNIGNTAIIVGKEFPSGYYAANRWCQDHQKTLKTIEAPNNSAVLGRTWNQQILDSINDNTAFVLISSVHWTNGTTFQLKEIGKKCKEHNALFIVDGTQSVGALDFDVVDLQIDALVCSVYKWLMGPYSIGIAYYSSFFDQGKPIEEGWLNRSNSKDFSALTNYVDDYMEGAGRYNVGAWGNFILLPMLVRGLEQVLEWQPGAIQAYCEALSKPLIAFLKENNFDIEEDAFRSKHFFGFLPPASVSKDALMQRLQEQKIYVSSRGDAIRFSVHVYNTPEDIQAFINVLKSLL